jgi:hypothetical protein
MQIKNTLLLLIIWIINSFLWIGSLSCKNSHALENIGYDLLKPTETVWLPDSLREISGITLLDSITLACIQDENGVVFIYDMLHQKVKSELNFYKDGDYEGICNVDTSIFILRSDGALFEISNYLSKILKVIPYPTEIIASNNEGLCYDKAYHRLLIAGKNRLAKGKEYKNKRAIYAFDLKTKTLNATPVMEFDVDTIKKIALEEKIKLPLKHKKKNKTGGLILRFASSEIAIHPITGKVFLLSAKDHLLFVINKNGSIEYVERLNPLIFVQPEGIAFFKNGDMLITNEGQKGNSTLLRFNYKQPQ